MKLTAFLVISLFSCNVGTPNAQQTLREGVWGGKGIQLTVTADGAAVDYGCDSGTVDEKIETDSQGKLHSLGTHVFGRGGPRKAGDPLHRAHEARYEGVRRGDKLELTVLLPELNRNLGKFNLKFGERPALERCG